MALVALLALAACSQEREPAASEPTPAPVAAPLPLASTTQHDLVRELERADETGTWDEVERRWEGRVLRWQVTRHPVLCRSAEACHVAAFPAGHPARQGWLPELRFAPGQFAALEAECGTAGPCDLTIEGTLATLVVSPELPTSLVLSGVRVLTRTVRR